SRTTCACSAAEAARAAGAAVRPAGAAARAAAEAVRAAGAAVRPAGAAARAAAEAVRAAGAAVRPWCLLGAALSPAGRSLARFPARWPDTLGGVILIDPPMWPAHRTRFSHLVSDHTLAELHRFATTAGLAERAFDQDHYDVPAERHEELVQLGAQPVSAGELIRRLRRSGLRLSARERPHRARAVLGQRWAHLLPGHPELGTQLLDRWSEQQRRYHTTAHLLDV